MTTAVPELMQTAVTAYQSGDWGLAARTCESVLRLVPNHPNALLMLGAIYAQSGAAQSAIAIFEQLRQMAPNDVNVLTNLGGA